MVKPVKSFSLSELSYEIKEALNQHLEISYWVVAEISELKVNGFSGHCYLELVEKDDSSGQILARMRATIWAPAFKMLKPYFETSTGVELGSGMKVMVRGVVDYHEAYGISLNIRDIDPAYTVGEAAIRMQQTIELLNQDGVLDMNRDLELELLPQRIALISSRNAAGYQDFMDQLLNNEYGYVFNVELFNSVMQGERAPESIMSSLTAIFDRIEDFDVVVVIRGGGAVLDLDCFNDYELCFMAAQFPLPILSGIGHDKDETVLDVVAHTKLKTPTAVAEFLVGRLADFESRMEELYDTMVFKIHRLLSAAETKLEVASNKIIPLVNRRMDYEKYRLEDATNKLHTGLERFFQKQEQKLDKAHQSLVASAQKRLQKENERLGIIEDRLPRLAQQHLKDMQQKLDSLQLKVNMHDPAEMLEKGYTITTLNGKKITSSKDMNKGDKIETWFKDGKRGSVVE